MPLLALLLLLAFFFLLVLSMPLLLVLRYRSGIVRRKARRSVALANLISLLISSAIFIWVAAMTNFWIARAFGFSLLGLASGIALGLAGLVVTRWENTAHGWFYTPNRWLVLFLTLAVSARMIYGLWRIWHVWRTTGHDSSWLASAGVPGSMAVGAIVLGYYVSYNAGVCWQLRSVR